MKRIQIFIPALLAASQLVASEPQADPSPNFLLILSDDQGWGSVSIEMRPGVPESKSTYLETPSLERLASEGLRLSSGYSPAAVCTPTRRSIQCGTSTARSGSEFASWWPTAEKLTIPKALKSVNPDYRCAHFGKWGKSMGALPEEAGYDVSDGDTCNPEGGYRQPAERDIPYYLVDDPKRTESVTQRAIDFIMQSAESDTPFYAQVSYYAVHTDIELRKETLAHFENKGEPDRACSPGFAGMLKEMDDGVGRLLTALDEAGIADNTYVIFLSDNGGVSKDRKYRGNAPSCNAPLSGQKWSIAEGGIRVPFLARGPGIPAGAATDVPVNGYDLLPTFYALAGGTAPLPVYIDGGSLAGLLQDPEKGLVQRPFDGLVFNNPRAKRDPQSAIRRGNHKLLVTWTMDGSAITKRELFDVVVDPGEHEDLSETMPELAAELENALTAYLASVDAPTSFKTYTAKVKAASGQ